MIYIRKYQSEEAKALAEIYYQTIHQINCKDYNPTQINAWAPESCLNEEGWSKKFSYTNPWVAHSDNKCVGFVEFEPDGHIDCFYCHHEWVGHGIGKALMQAVEEEANALGIKRIFAEVSITAQPFFKKMGFVITAQQTVVLRGVELINFKMEKYL